MIKLTEKEARRASPSGVVIISRKWKESRGSGESGYRVSAVQVLEEKGPKGELLAKELEGPPEWSHFVTDKSGVSTATADLLRWLDKLGSTAEKYAYASRHRVVKKAALAC